MLISNDRLEVMDFEVVRGFYFQQVPMFFVQVVVLLTNSSLHTIFHCLKCRNHIMKLTNQSLKPTWHCRKIENGEWRIENGEWRMENGKRE